MLVSYASILELGLQGIEKKEDERGKPYYVLPEEAFSPIASAARLIINKGYQTKDVLEAFHDVIHHEEIPAEMIKTASLLRLLERSLSCLPEKQRAIVLLEPISNQIEVSVAEILFPNVILNLVANAVVHGHATQVRIWFNEAERTLHVRDNGSGVAEQDLPYLFELRYKSKNSPGNGVGLAFVRMIIEASLGSIICLSKQGAGSYTEFVIHLP
jgi:two-component system sensor histidine kinase ResE